MTLLDAPGDGPGFRDLAEARRVELSNGAWVDVLPAWHRQSSDLFESLVAVVPWHACERTM